MQQNSQYTPSQTLLKDQLSQIRLLSSELQAKESENSLLRAELSKLSETCYDFQQKSDCFENRYKFQAEEQNLKESVLFEEISSLKRQKQALKAQNLEIQQKMLGLVREIAGFQEEIERLTQEKAALLQEIEGFKGTCYRWELENEHLTAKLVQKNEICTRNLKEIQALKAVNDALCRENAGLKEDLKRKGLEIAENQRVFADFKAISESFQALEENFARNEDENRRLREDFEEKQREIQEICRDFEAERETFAREKSVFEENSKQLAQEVEQEREKVRRKDHEIQLSSTKLEETERKLSDLEEDLRAISLKLDENAIKTLDFRSGSLHLSVLKSRFAEIFEEKRRARKHAKKLGKNQGFLLEDLKKIHGKLLSLGAMAENRENSQLSALKTQFEEKLNEIDKAYVDRESRLEAIAREKDQEIARLTRTLTEHIAIIAKKEAEKGDLLGLLAENAEKNGKIQRKTSDLQGNQEKSQQLQGSCTVIALLSQVLALASEKYANLLEIKPGCRFLWEYYWKIGGNLQRIRAKRLKIAGFCVIFCEILCKMWTRRRKARGFAKKLEFSLKIKGNPLFCALPRNSLEIGGPLESLVWEIFSRKSEAFDSFVAILAVVCKESQGNAENPAKIRRNPQVLPFITAKHVENIRLLLEKSESSKRNSGVAQRSVLLGEENAYVKAKLEEMAQKVEELGLENEGLKRLLDDSENKRSILIQNFKELEKHAQILNEENQNLKKS